MTASRITKYIYFLKVWVELLEKTDDPFLSFFLFLFQPGVLTFLVKEIDQLVRASAWYQMDVSQCEACGRSPGDILQLESELHLTQEAADRLQRLLNDKTVESKRREEEATCFKNQV